MLDQQSLEGTFLDSQAHPHPVGWVAAEGGASDPRPPQVEPPLLDYGVPTIQSEETKRKGCVGHAQARLCWFGADVAVRAYLDPEGFHCGETIEGGDLCASWNCVDHFQRKRSRMAWRIADELVTWPEGVYVWTFTLRDVWSGWDSPCPTCQSWTMMGDSWNRFLTRVRQVFSNVKFLGVLEFTRAGVAHLHVAFNLRLPKSWVESTWIGAAEVGSWLTWVTPISSKEGIAKYMAKYLAKAGGSGAKNVYPKGARRVRVARSVSLARPKPEGTWSIWKKSRVRAKLSEIGIGNLTDWFEGLIREEPWVFDGFWTVKHLAAGEVGEENADEVRFSGDLFSATCQVDPERRRFVIA